MTSREDAFAGAPMTPARMAADILALNPNYNPPPSRHQSMAENMIALGERALAMNPIQLAPAANRPALFGPVPWGPQTVQHGSFKLAEGFGTGTPAAPVRQPERPPQAQPERTPPTADERSAGEHSEGDAHVAKNTVGFRLPGGKRVVLTDAQKSVWTAISAQRDAILRKVRAREPDWDPTPGFFETFEGAVAHEKAVIEEAEKRLRELRREEAEKWRREPGLPK